VCYADVINKSHVPLRYSVQDCGDKDVLRSFVACINRIIMCGNMGLEEQVTSVEGVLNEQGKPGRKEERKEGRGEGGREGRKEGGGEGRREGRKEGGGGGREGGRKEGREEGRKEWWEGGREG
jgi:hypothetical protein